MSLASGGGPTAVVAALGAELAGVLAAATELRPLHLGGRPGGRATVQRGWRGWNGWSGWSGWSGRLAGEPVVLAATGDGAAAAADGLAALFAAARPRRLLVLGVSGGLTPGLAAGTLVAARQVVGEDGKAAAVQAPDAEWLARAVAGGALAGTAVSVRRILGDPGAKQAALRLAGEPAAPAAVDLESATFAALATAHGVPYLVLRAVLDPAEETLPLDFEACRGAGGGVSNARVVLRALIRPRRFAGLWRLRGRVRDAASRLGALAERLVAAPCGVAGAAACAATAAGQRGGEGVRTDLSSRHEIAMAGRRRA
jgi:adenosylhomocysteine nucleosidase